MIMFQLNSDQDVYSISTGEIISSFLLIDRLYVEHKAIMKTTGMMVKMLNHKQ